MDVTYEDNSPILQLFLAKPFGLLSLLDEQTNFPQVSVFSLFFCWLIYCTQVHSLSLPCTQFSLGSLSLSLSLFVLTPSFSLFLSLFFLSLSLSLSLSVVPIGKRRHLYVKVQPELCKSPCLSPSASVCDGFHDQAFCWSGQSDEMLYF